MEGQGDWQNKLYNGLIQDLGRTPRVSTGAITKPLREKQLSERPAAAAEVATDNNRNRGLHRQSKQRFSVHRTMAFMGQE